MRGTEFGYGGRRNRAHMIKDLLILAVVVALSLAVSFCSMEAQRVERISDPIVLHDYSGMGLMAAVVGDLLYVAGTHEVGVYDIATGEKVREIGREGRGPGEFMRIRSLAATADGRVSVFDGQNRMTILGDGAPRQYVTQLATMTPPMVRGDVAEFLAYQVQPGGMAVNLTRWDFESGNGSFQQVASNAQQVWGALIVPAGEGVTWKSVV